MITLHNTNLKFGEIQSPDSLRKLTIQWFDGWPRETKRPVNNPKHFLLLYRAVYIGIDTGVPFLKLPWVQIKISAVVWEASMVRDT